MYPGKRDTLHSASESCLESRAKTAACGAMWSPLLRSCTSAHSASDHVGSSQKKVTAGNSELAPCLASLLMPTPVLQVISMVLTYLTSLSHIQVQVAAFCLLLSAMRSRRELTASASRRPSWAQPPPAESRASKAAKVKASGARRAEAISRPLANRTVTFGNLWNKSMGDSLARLPFQSRQATRQRGWGQAKGRLSA